VSVLLLEEHVSKGEHLVTNANDPNRVGEPTTQRGRSAAWWIFPLLAAGLFLGGTYYAMTHNDRQDDGAPTASQSNRVGSGGSAWKKD
jgi:hypothetical protein